MAPISSEKVMSSFLPAATHGLEESERHYLSVHVPLARRVLGAVDAVRHYCAYKATHQLDANGTFERVPSVWRWALQRFEVGAPVTFPADVAQRLSDDHVLCLSHLRRCDVEEAVLFDRVGGQTTLAPYLIDVERRDGADAEETRRLTDALAARLAERAGALPGIRRVAINRVTREAVAEPMDEPGQLLTDRFVEDGAKVAFLEVVADDRLFGDPLFADEAVDQALMALAPLAEVACVAAEELCGFDRR